MVLRGPERAQANSNDAVRAIDALVKKNPELLAKTAASKALFFTHTKKTGVVVALELGDGFITKQYSPGRWSAPLFYRIKGGSVGFTVGRTDNLGLISIGTEEGLYDFIDGARINAGASAAYHTGGTLEGQAAGQRVGAASREISDNTEMISVQDILFVWGDSIGYSADASLKGVQYSIDKEFNAAIYGGFDITPEQILSGSIASPPQLQNFFSRLATALNTGH